MSKREVLAVSDEKLLAWVEMLVAHMSRPTFVWRMNRFKNGGMVTTNKALMKAARELDEAAQAYVMEIRGEL